MKKRSPTCESDPSPCTEEKNKHANHGNIFNGPVKVKEIYNNKRGHAVAAAEGILSSKDTSLNKWVPHQPFSFDEITNFLFNVRSKFLIALSIFHKYWIKESLELRVLKIVCL